MNSTLPVSLSDVRTAAIRIQQYISTTPLVESRRLNNLLGFRLMVKAESAQVTGSFKTRGAANQILQLTEAEKRAGIVAWSSGNHAQAVAHMARQFGVAATILMPHDAPKLKMERTRAYGAEIVTYNRKTESRDVVGNRLVAERNARLIHSYNDPRTIAGQGTVGLELFNQTHERGITPDALIVNCCGGGLASGIALTRDLYAVPPTLYTAEPELFNDAQRSLTTGILAQNDMQSGSICDALLMPSMGLNPFSILSHHKAKGLTASDGDVQAAMGFADEFFKLTLEPSGAVALACAFLNAQQFKGKTVVVTATGGNVDAIDFVKHTEVGRKHRTKLLCHALG